MPQQDPYSIFGFLQGLSPIESRLFERRNAMKSALPKSQQREFSLASLLGLGANVRATPGDSSLGGYGGLLQYFT